MKLSTPVIALATIATTYMGVAHAQNTTEKGAAAAGSILDALKAAGLTTLANLATTHSDLLVRAREWLEGGVVALRPRPPCCSCPT